MPGDNDIIDKHLVSVESELRDLFAANQTDPARFLRSAAHQFGNGTPYCDLSKAHMHDPDFVIFQHFRSTLDLIVDVGANNGMSAISIWVSGSPARVTSFEALGVHETSLQAVKAAFGDRFEYTIIGIGKSDSVCEFIIPVVNGHGLSAMATASADIHWRSLAENTIRFGALEDLQAGQDVELDLAFEEAPVTTLDNALAVYADLSDDERIVAIKIDVEGLEPDVIAGATDVLSTQRPLLLIESGCYHTEMIGKLASMGYRIARRQGNQLYPCERAEEALNTFFYHKDRMSDYQDIGLMPHPGFGAGLSILRRVRRYFQNPGHKKATN